MPVGTAATVKAMYPGEVAALGADIVLANTYHLMLRPGAERIAALGGLHRFMNWPRPILTDSGGFQVMSLANLRKMSENGVLFRSHIDGAAHELSPERAIEIQNLLDADIVMQLDECVALPASDEVTEKAMRLSLRWAERCQKAFGRPDGRALFAIVQGGGVEGSRIESAKTLASMDFSGYAIGGLAVGEPQEVMLRMIEAVEPHLPTERPRYLMGVGTPDDIVKSVERGIDMFDCVMPTRAGRHGLAFTRFGKVNLRNAKHADDIRRSTSVWPLPPPAIGARLFAPSRQGRRDPRHDELTAINLAYYQDLMAGARKAIGEGRLQAYIDETRLAWAEGEAERAQRL